MSVRDEKTRVHETAQEQASTIAALNDDLRCRGRGGTFCATAGVIAPGRDALPAILAAMRGFAAFDRQRSSRRARLWRTDLVRYQAILEIDYYDRGLRCGLLDPADPSVTTRVLTVMLAEEW